ncbi:MAG: hypothetical protein ABJD68_10635 [Nakamurella sp.]
MDDRAHRLLADPTGEDLARHLIDFDPREPQHYLFAAAATSPEAVALAAGQLHPDPIPWPAGLAPDTQPFGPDITDISPLPQADVLVVTYTVAEGYGLADVLTPGLSTTGWMPYRNNWDQLKKTVGKGAPSLNPHRNQAGLWALTSIGPRTVVVVKSDLHPVTDGPKLPICTLWAQMIDQVKPRLVITTGTAGGIGGDTLLGDVIVSQHLRWDCTKKFQHDPFAQQAYTSTGPALATTTYQLAAGTLIPVNAVHLPAAARPPGIVTRAGADPASVLTTDFFAFDDAANSYGLRTYEPTARAVEMDDSALPLACTDLADPPPWVSVRNASDPQMTGGTIKDEAQQAAAIYEKYGYWTTINSAITCWAVITSLGA